jgi:predicted ribosomally synthesized peptide with SipW-like signal peptide
MMHRLLMVLLLVGLIAGQAGMGTTACFTDTELNADNTFQAWVSSQWVQTTQGDFQAGVLDNVDTSSSPGDVKLAVKSDWYNTSWSYRRPVTISNPGSGLTAYQVKVDVTYDSDMKSNFDDIRFTDADGSTLLFHWRESYIASASATFWVKIPSVPSGNKTIYMYYGNASASSASDGDATFEFFDDFEDGDISDWSQYGSGTVQIANDGGNYVLLKTAYNDKNGGYSLFNNGALSNFEAVFRTKRVNESGGAQNRYGIEDGSFNGYGPRMYDFNSLPSAFAIERRTWGVGSDLASKSTSAYQWNTWMTVKFRRYGSTLEFELYDSSGSLAESISTSNALYSSFDRFVVHGGFEFYTDDIRVRKYTSAEPTTSVGSEQGMYVSSGTIASQVLDTGVAGAKWDALFWGETLPSNTDITFEVRASNTSFAKNATTPSWTFVGGTSPVTSGLPSGRYLQWRATLTTSDTSQTPTLHDVTIDYD